MSVLALMVGASLAMPASAQTSGQTSGQTPAQAAAMVERPVSFAIPAQDLNGAILSFADKAGYQVFYDVFLVRDLRSPGVSGTMAPSQALSRLLAGTGLSYRITGAHAVSLAAAPAAATPVAASADESSAVPTLQVQATAREPIGYVSDDQRTNLPTDRASVDKTGTQIGDLPGTVSVIPHQVLEQQGATTLRQGVINSSGVNYGGQDSKGYYDHFEIRGLNAQVYSDGFSDGDELSGLVHSLNGVERIEVLEGPGSALLGSGPPGGTINIIHYKPSSEFHIGTGVQYGSFNTVTNNDYITGPTGIDGLNYRVDATVQHSDGFRDLASHDYEIRPAFQWHLGDHTIDAALDLRQMNATPDSYGLIYFNGTPISNVSDDAKYSSPFDFAKQTYIRPTISDKWVVNDMLTVNNRFSYLHRTLDAMVNGDSANTKVVGGQVVGRQLRQQDDTDASFDYQLEPVWRFDTGSVRHTLLTGFEYNHQTLATGRETADLPNIPNAFAPVPPETLATVLFQCDAKHSCDQDQLEADYYSLYATDQVDVTDKLKVRVGVREDWFNTGLTPQITVPGRFGTSGQPLLAGVTDQRNDSPFSWNVGVLYKLTPWMSPYFGVSQSHLANFNSENTQNGIGAPESALQFEAGIKFSTPGDRVIVNTALFNVDRNNVAVLTPAETVVFDSQRTKGAEISLDAKINDHWHLLANATGQQAVITDNPQGLSAIGKIPQGVPAFMANLWTTYNFSVDGIPGFHVGGGLNYQDKTYSDTTNLNSIPAYIIANAEVGYSTARWDVDLYLDNITNQRYFIAANGAGAYVGNPLSVFASARLHY